MFHLKIRADLTQFTTTLQEVTWNNSRLIKGNIAEEVSKLKQQFGQNIVILGSGDLVHTLMHHHLIDEYALVVCPDEAFADLFPGHGQPALAPWRLALVTVFQFMEGLTDRQAADAVRDRLAWKYALSLELTDTGFDHTVLSEFRSRLVEGNAEQRLLDLLLQRCREGGWRNRSRTAAHRLDPCPGQDPRT